MTKARKFIAVITIIAIAVPMLIAPVFAAVRSGRNGTLYAVKPAAGNPSVNTASKSESANSIDGLYRAAASRRLPGLTLDFAGDLMAHPPNFLMSDYHRIYRAVEDRLLNDDLSFVNMEFVMDQSRPMSGFPSFNVHRDYGEAAIDAGFDVFARANNHINDYGSSGIRASRIQQYQLMYYASRSWNRPVYFSGTRMPGEDDFMIQEIDHRGWRIGFLSVTGMLNQYYSGVESAYLVPLYDKKANEKLLSFIRDNRDKYDLFILAYHGGVEYQLQPDRTKARLFRQFVDAGVDIVWGHHPHVMQPIEFIPRGDGRYGAIMYSMGNFVSSQPSTLGSGDGEIRRAYTGDSVIAELQVVMTGQGPDVRSITPYLITHLREYKRDSLDRDGFEVHYTADAADIARDEWKQFYRLRYSSMLSLMGPVSARYYQKTHPMP